MAIIWGIISSISAKAWKYIAGFFIAVGLFFYAFFKGRRSRERQLEKDNANVTNRMFEESTKSPKSKDELTDRLRERGL